MKKQMKKQTNKQRRKYRLMAQALERLRDRHNDRWWTTSDYGALGKAHLVDWRLQTLRGRE